jgi:hypothetical protein
MEYRLPYHMYLGRNLGSISKISLKVIKGGVVTFIRNKVYSASSSNVERFHII